MKRRNPYPVGNIMQSNLHSFGMLMKERTFSSGKYRFGFNGKENDNEVKGEGNQQDYGFRISDTRLGRFLSEDPLTKKYPELTPYQFASNTPIQAIDLDGCEAQTATAGEQDLKTGNTTCGQSSTSVAPNLLFKPQLPPVPEKVQQPATPQATATPSSTNLPSALKLPNAGIGPIIPPDQGEIKATEPTWADNLSASPSILGRATYSVLDGFYLTGQNLGGRQLQGKTQATHLNGTQAVGDESVDAFANTVAVAFPYGKIGQITGYSGAFAQSVLKSSAVGVGSKYFGNSFARNGAAGLLNQTGSAFKIGWSTSTAGGMVMRVGIGVSKSNIKQAAFHLTLRSTFVENAVANPFMSALRVGL